MHENNQDMQIREFEQEAQSDQDMESMVPPVWSNSTYTIVAGMVAVLLLIGIGVAFWG